MLSEILPSQVLKNLRSLLNINPYQFLLAGGYFVPFSLPGDIGNVLRPFFGCHN